MSLNGKTALVTGGASGVGAAVARLFVAKGCKVAIADINLQAAKALADELGEAAMPCVLDVGDAGQVSNVVDGIVTQWGAIDILVNSAGVLLNKPFIETEPAEFERMLRINLLGSCLVAQASARRMLGRGGRIINISSAAGLMGFPGRTAYAASKGGIIAATRVMAIELAEHDILVNTVAPGPVETAMTAGVYDERFRRGITASVPLNRVATPEEIAEVVEFLASPASRYVTGQTISADGGMSITGITRKSLSANG
ncbi:Sorbitol dehydrogenase [compost metagenome]